MKHSLGIWIGASWLLAALTLLMTGDERALSSTAWAVDAVISLCAIMWPLLLGMGIADSTRIFRPSGSQELVLALPGKLGCLLLIRRAFASATWASIGLLAAVLLSIAITVVNGSVLLPAPFLSLAVAVAGNFAFVFLGQAFGLLLPLWIAPPLGAIALYLVYGFNLGGIGELFAFLSVGTPTSITTVLRGDIFVWYMATFIALLIIALALIASAIWRRITVAALFTLLAMSTLLAGSSIIQHEGKGEVFDYLPEQQRVCGEVPGGNSIVCLSKEQESDPKRAVELLAPIDARVRELTLSPFGITYSPFTAGTSRQIMFSPPIGQEEAKLDEVAMSIMYSLADCGDAALPNDRATDIAIDTVATWIVPEFSGEGMLLERADLPEGGPTLEAAQQSLSTLRRCEANE